MATGKANHRTRKSPKQKLTGKKDLARTVEELRRQVEKHRKKERQFDELIHFEKLLLEISTSLVNLPAEGVGREIEKGLRRIVEVLRVDQSSVYEFSGDRSRLNLLHSWTGEGFRKPSPTLESEEFPWMTETLRGARLVAIPRVRDLAKEAAKDTESLQKQGIRSILATPLGVGQNVRGVVTFSALGAERDWPEPFVQQVRVIGEIFANALARKEAEEALKKKDQRLSEAQRIAHLGHWDWNILTNELTCTDEAYRILGISPQDFGATYEAFLECVHPRDRELVKEAVDRTLADPSIPYSLEHRVARRDGEEQVVHERGELTLDKGGRPVRMIGTVQDMTENKQIEGSLQKSRVELRRLSSRLISVQEEERKKIARELHDGIGQTLSAIKYLIENTLQTRAHGPVSSQLQSLRPIIPLIQNAIEEVRRIQTDLRPPTLDDLGILATLSWFCREYQKIYSGIHVERDIQVEEDDIPDSLKTVIYRILQEATNNVAKYSHATRLSLSLKKKDDGIELVVEDNGLGFDPREILSGDRERRGFGLTSMRERAELSGGSFSLESEKGSGTRVRAAWRLKGSQAGTKS